MQSIGNLFASCQV